MTFHEFNILSKEQLIEELRKCCGSSAWVKRMLPFIPADDLVELLEDAEDQWYECSEADWKEAFAYHPKIGDIDSLSKGLPSEKKKFASTAQWASGEQSGVNTASMEVLKKLYEGNKLYEEKFGYTFIICATGKSAEEMLENLEERLQNSPKDEIKVAAGEQNKITQLRLEKLLS